MSNLFEGYRIVVLDSTFFSAYFTQELKEGLNNTKVYVSGTFNAEIEEYRKVISEERKKIYSENFDYLNKNVVLNTMNLDSTGGRADKLNNDIWGLISLMVELNKKFNAKIAIVTANRILIEKIILKGIDADLYDLNKRMFIEKGNFFTLRNKFSFHEVTSVEKQTDIRVTTGTTVYSKNYKSIILGDEITSGLEATIYCVKSDKSYIVKIFKKDKLSASKLKNLHNISGINDDLKIEWALFPTEVVYSDSECKIPIGFIEKRVTTGANLDNNALYWGDPLSVEEEYLTKRISYSLDICLKVVRQICYLNTYGFFVSDYNMGNFAFSNLSSDVIQMWDTDSFGYQNFFGRYFSPEYKECKNHPPYDISKKEGAIAICEDALHQFVFKVLALGDSPISEFKQTFKYDNENYPNVIRSSFFPSNVWNYLADVFKGKKEPSSETLLYELTVAQKRLKQYPNEDKTVKQLFIDFLPGYLEYINEKEPISNEVTSNHVTNSPNTYQNSIGQTNMNQTQQQDPKTEKHPIKKLFKFLFWMIIGYCIYAWFAWEQLPWETEAWNYLFGNNTITASIEVDNRNFDYSFFDEKGKIVLCDSGQML